jgi:glycosyltransferase involved in cell wall biosynthesis
MRIALVVHKFPPESLGGTEVYTWALARALGALGHEVHVFYPSPDPAAAEAPLEREGIHVWRIPGRRAHGGIVGQFWHTFRDARIEAAFTRFLARVQPQIVHFQHVQEVSARLMELARGVPRLLTLADYWFFCANGQLVRPDRLPCALPKDGWHCAECAISRGNARWLGALRPLVALPFVYRNWYLRRMMSQVDLFLAPSEFLRQQYLAQGFPAERFMTFENGLDTERLEAPADVELPLPVARPHFGFIGSLAWQKGVHVLVEAFNLLGEDAALTIYGPEAVFPDYVTEVKARVRHPHVRFAGLLDRRHIGAALRQFDCLVVPSLWYENSPLVIQEAYGVGIPVVASRLGAMTEKVRDGVTGLLFTPGDSEDLARVLRELIDHSERLAALKANIRPAPSIQEHTRQMVGIYRALVDGQAVAELIPPQA